MTDDASSVAIDRMPIVGDTRRAATVINRGSQRAEREGIVVVVWNVGWDRGVR